jgi:hypothetical protein
VPREVISELRFVPVERMDDVIAIALHTPSISNGESETASLPIKAVKPRRALVPKETVSRVGANPGSP